MATATARLGFEVFENVRGGASEFERGFSRDWFDIRGTAHAVRPENFIFWIHRNVYGGSNSTFTARGEIFTTVTPPGLLSLTN